MEDLITILLFLGIAVFSLIQKVRSKQKDAEKSKSKVPPKQGTLAFKINEFIARVQERIEAETRQRESPDSQWREIMDDDTSGGQQYEELEDLVLEDEPGMPPEPVATRIPPRPPRRKRPVESPLASEAVQPVRRSSRQLPRNRSDLRKAVVWAEIIGPPVALRDKHPRP